METSQPRSNSARIERPHEKKTFSVRGPSYRCVAAGQLKRALASIKPSGGDTVDIGASLDKGIHNLRPHEGAAAGLALRRGKGGDGGMLGNKRRHRQVGVEAGG